MSGRKKQVRQAFRDAVYRRDRHRCAVCGHRPRPEEWDKDRPPLDAHHITDRNEMPNGGYVVENGISLCDACHLLAEAEHNGQEPAPGYSRAELYARVSSSFEKAYAASERPG
jgi:5-methylcytosine-specific restriction endonuclease McrA